MPAASRGLQTLRHQSRSARACKATILQASWARPALACQTNVVTEITIGEGAEFVR